MDVKRAAGLYAQGRTRRQIGAELGVPLTAVVEDLSAVDRRGLTEMLVDKIIIERYASKIDKDGRRTTLSAPFRTKILSKTLSGYRRCTMLGSRSFPESERVRGSGSLGPADCGSPVSEVRRAT